jgi:DNA-binding XRE family transcriptional regulator
MSKSGGTPSPREDLAAALDVAHNVWTRAKIAALAGVSPRQAANAIAGRPVSTVAHLRLCVALGLDPLPQFPHAQVAPANFDFVVFALAMRMARALKKHTEREAAAAMKVSPSTVCRIENAHEMTITVILKVCVYVGAHPFGYFKVAPDASVPRETFSEATVPA